MKNIDLSIIIPAYNEEGNIGPTVKKVIDYLAAGTLDYEIIVVDDGSNDRTSQEILDLQSGKHKNRCIRLLQNHQNSGKGYSVKRGVLESNADIVLFMDADLAYDLKTIVTMYEAVRAGNQVVIGSRNLPDSIMNAHVPFMRFISGKVYSLIIQFLMFRGISDTQCGIKCFEGKTAQMLFDKISIFDFGFDVEVLYIAKKYGCSILSIPVTMIKHRKESRVNIFSDSIKMFFDLFMIRWNDLTGKY